MYYTGFCTVILTKRRISARPLPARSLAKATEMFRFAQHDSAINDTTTSPKKSELARRGVNAGRKKVLPVQLCVAHFGVFALYTAMTK